MKHLVLLLGFLLSAMVLAASADTITTTFSVMARIPSRECTVTATDLNFVTYYPNGSAPARSWNSIGVLCDNQEVVSIYPNHDSSGVYASNNRYMMSNGKGDLLAYDLYTDHTYTQPWNINNPEVLSLVPYQTFLAKVYGQIPAGEFEPPGNYSDKVTVFVTF